MVFIFQSWISFREVDEMPWIREKLSSLNILWSRLNNQLDFLYDFQMVLSQAHACEKSNDIDKNTWKPILECKISKHDAAQTK